jgi:putative flippase GtrA
VSESVTKKKNRLGRGAVIGVAATVIDLISLYLLVDVLGLSATLANIPALLAGLVVQFFGNKYFAFQDHSKQLVKQGMLFGLVELGALAFNAGVFHVLIHMTLLPYLLVRVIASALVYFLFSYPLWSLIFKPEAR